MIFVNLKIKSFKKKQMFDRCYMEDSIIDRNPFKNPFKNQQKKIKNKK